MERTKSNISINNIEVKEDKNIKNTLLYLKNINFNGESYESKILSEENIENIVKYQVAYEGENRLLKYDVSNTLSFDEYLRSNKLSKRDVCDILIAIDDILLSVENYLISENSISLDLKTIRVTKKRNNRLAFKFIAVPNLKSDFSYELSKFLIRILRYVDVEDKDALSLAYGLFVKSSKDNYTMNDLMELVDRVRDKDETLGNEISMEDLINYDEEMAKEISEEVMAENSFDLSTVDFEKVENDNSKCDAQISDSLNNDDILIDDNTKNIIEENIFNDFNKDDKKIVKMKKNLFGIKNRKSYKAHINVGLLIYAIVPLFIILLPIIYLFLKS